MPVTIVFRDGGVRQFHEATDALLQGGVLRVTNAHEELRVYQADEILTATVTLPTGVQIVVFRSPTN